MQNEPTVLPARVPNLLVNGASGIAVGIATNIPPHNLREVVAGLCALIHNPDVTVKQLMQHIPAPDFPTGTALEWPCYPHSLTTCYIEGHSLMGQDLAAGGEILDTDLIRQAYHEGRGSITVRGKVHIENESETAPSSGSQTRGKASRKAGSGKPQIVVSELPYQSNKVRYI